MFVPGSYADPAQSYDIITDVAKGHVKAAMVQRFKDSGEHGVKIQRKPELKVYATKAFAAGKLELASFSNTLHVVKRH